MFEKYLVTSIISHIALVLILVIKTTFFPSQDIIIPQAIKVNMVSLPDKIKLPKKIPPKPKPKPRKVKNNLKKTKSKQKKALQRLKALNAIEKLKGEVSKNKTPRKPKQFKGNILNKGDSLTGLEKIHFNEYYLQLRKHIRNHWDLPQWLADANLKAEAIVVIDRQGNMTSKKILTSSGNEIFDNKVLSAIDTASPFPEPPPGLRNVIGTGGITFGFP